MNQENQSVEEIVSTPKKPFYKKWWFWVLIAAAIFVISVVSSTGSNAPSNLIDLPETEYRSQCQSYTYDSIARNPEQYSGKLAVLTGEVIQVMKNGDEIQMRVNITKTTYGYTDTVFVFYNITNGVNVLEGDIITMYGELRGMQEYESIFGQQISIPRIYVKYVDLNQKN